MRLSLSHILGSTTALSFLTVSSIMAVVAPASAASFLKNGDTVQFGGTVALDLRGAPVGFFGNALLFCPRSLSNPSPDCPPAPVPSGLSYANAATPVTGITNVGDSANTGYFSAYNSPNNPLGSIYRGTARSFDASTFTAPAPGDLLGDIANFLLFPQITEGSNTTYATQVTLLGNTIETDVITLGTSTNFLFDARGLVTVFNDANLNGILDAGESILETAKATIALSTQNLVNYGDGRRSVPTSFSGSVVVAVPEPSSTVGVLALVGLATTGLLKKKGQKI